MFELKSIEDIMCGDIIIHDGKSMVRRYILGSAPIGLAAHDVKKGDLIKYSPFKNTRNVIIKNLNNNRIQTDAKEPYC